MDDTSVTKAILVRTYDKIQSVQITGLLHDKSSHNHKTKDTNKVPNNKLDPDKGITNEATLTSEDRIKDLRLDRSDTVEPRASIENVVNKSHIRAVHRTETLNL